MDRCGRRPVLLIGLGACVLAMLGSGAVLLLPVYIVLRLVQSGGNSAATVCDGTVVADVTPRERLGEATGYFGFAQSVATAVGPALGLALAAALGYRWMYFICAGVLAAAMVLAFFCSYEKEGAGGPGPAPAPAARPAERNVLLRFIEPKALPASLIHFLYFVACAFTVYYLATYADEFSIANVGIFYTASAIGMIPPRLFSGRLGDRFGALPVVAAGTVCGMVSYGLILLAGQMWILLPAAGAIYGLALGLVTPPLQARAVRAASDDRRGVANSTFFISISVGLGAGGALFGITISRLGYVGTVISAMALMALALALSFLFLRDRPEQQSAV